MAKQPKGISYTPIFEPDMASMVKALKLLLDGGGKKINTEERDLVVKVIVCTNRGSSRQ